MSLTCLAALLLVGQLVTLVLAQSQCPQQLRETCSRAGEIRMSPDCPRGGTSTGAQRPLNDPPTSQYANNCMCATTYYSLVSACELCYGRQPVSWGTWHQNCRQFAKNGAGQDEWPQYGYPDWAKLFYQDSEAFSIDRLRREGLLEEPASSPQPEVEQPAPTPPPAPGSSSPPASRPSSTTSTDPAAVTSSTVSSGSSTRPESSISETTSTSRSQYQSDSSTSSIISPSLSSVLPNNPNVPNPSDDPYGIGPSATRGAGNSAPPGQVTLESGSGKGLNVGAIVGGVVGGLFLILLIAGLLYFFVLHRRKRRTPPSAAYMAQFGDGSSRAFSPRSFTPDPSAPVQLHSATSSLENARAESPTLPRASVDLFTQYQAPNQPSSNGQDPFNPPENHAEMRENNNVSRQSTRRYTRTPTPLIGPRPR